MFQQAISHPNGLNAALIASHNVTHFPFVSRYTSPKSDCVAGSQVCRCNCISHHLYRKCFSNGDFLSTRRGWITMPWPDLLLVLWHLDRCLLRADVAKSCLKSCDIMDLFHSRLMSAGRKISNGLGGKNQKGVALLQGCRQVSCSRCLYKWADRFFKICARKHEIWLVEYQSWMWASGTLLLSVTVTPRAR